jgi:outer membrane receptor protein involved in Fe transport
MISTEVGGNDLPFAPRVTWHAGAEYSHALGAHLRGFVRTEVVGTSRYYFDPNNDVSQGAMELVNASLGVVAGNWRLEAWVKNLFAREYVAMAMPYPGLAPSGYIGEPGAPRTIEVALTRTF